MKKLLSYLSFLSLFIPFFEVVKANEYQFFKTKTSIETGPVGGDNISTVEFYGVSTSGTETLLNSWNSPKVPNLQNPPFYETVTGISVDFGDARLDEYQGKIYLKTVETTNATNTVNNVLEYDLINNSVQKLDNISNTSDILIYPEVIKQMISEKADGSIHIGENSAVFKEEGGREKFWAQDANGKSIPIDITNGSKLLINGRDVEQSINNVGALSAALTGLPMVPTDTTLACGLGTGTHGGDFAFSGGCASKINKKLSINYAASMTIPGQEYTGDFEDQFSARAGFVWKLGKAIKPNQISIKEGKELKEEIIALKENNQNIISQNKALLARLEKLEKIALSENNSKDLAIYKLK